jgi:hypothetical protein
VVIRERDCPSPPPAHPHHDCRCCRVLIVSSPMPLPCSAIVLGVFVPRLCVGACALPWSSVGFAVGSSCAAMTLHTSAAPPSWLIGLVHHRDSAPRVQADRQCRKSGVNCVRCGRPCRVTSENAGDDWGRTHRMPMWCRTSRLAPNVPTHAPACIGVECPRSCTFDATSTGRH